MPRAFGTALRAENYSLCESRTPISEAVLGDAALVVAHGGYLIEAERLKKKGAEVTRAVGLVHRVHSRLSRTILR